MAMDNQRLIEEFVLYLKSVKRYSSYTCRSYYKDLNQLQGYLETTYAGISLLEVDRDMLRSFAVWLLDHRLKPASVHRKMVSVRSFYKKLILDGRMEMNPAQNLPLPKIPHRLPVFVDEDKLKTHPPRMIALAENRDEYESIRDALMVELLYATGMRLSELTGLSLSSIDLKQKFVKVYGKRAKERVIPLGETLIEEIEKYFDVYERYFKLCKPQDPLFRTSKGKKVYPMLVYRLINAYLSKLTTLDKKSPHVLRHSFATHLLNAGADIGAIKELLGHSSLASTQVYTHTSFEHLKSVYKNNDPRKMNPPKF